LYVSFLTLQVMEISWVVIGRFVSLSTISFKRLETEIIILVLTLEYNSMSNWVIWHYICQSVYLFIRTKYVLSILQGIGIRLNTLGRIIREKKNHLNVLCGKFLETINCCHLSSFYCYQSEYHVYHIHYFIKPLTQLQHNFCNFTDETWRLMHFFQCLLSTYYLSVFILGPIELLPFLHGA
jgi:hypothetical protein